MSDLAVSKLMWRVRRSITLGAAGGASFTGSGRGGGGGFTMIVVDAVREPPSPVAVIVYIVVLAGRTWRGRLGAMLPIPWSIDALDAFVGGPHSGAPLAAPVGAGFGG